MPDTAPIPSISQIYNDLRAAQEAGRAYTIAQPYDESSILPEPELVSRFDPKLGRNMSSEEYTQALDTYDAQRQWRQEQLREKALADQQIAAQSIQRRAVMALAVSGGDPQAAAELMKLPPEELVSQFMDVPPRADKELGIEELQGDDRIRAYMDSFVAHGPEAFGRMFRDQRPSGPPDAITGAAREEMLIPDAVTGASRRAPPSQLPSATQAPEVWLGSQVRGPYGNGPSFPQLQIDPNLLRR